VVKFTEWVLNAKFRIVLIGLLIPSIPLLLLAGILYLMFLHNTVELLTNNIDMTVSNVVERVETGLSRDIAMAQAFATRPHLLMMIQQGNLDEMKMHLKHLVDHLEHMDRTGIFNTQGIQIANYPFTPETMGLDFSRRDYFLGATKYWEPYVSDFFLRAGEPRRYVFAIAVPLQKWSRLLNSEPSVPRGNVLSAHLK